MIFVALFCTPPLPPCILPRCHQPIAAQSHVTKPVFFHHPSQRLCKNKFTFAFLNANLATALQPKPRSSPNKKPIKTKPETKRDTPMETLLLQWHELCQDFYQVLSMNLHIDGLLCFITNRDTKANRYAPVYVNNVSVQ